MSDRWVPDFLKRPYVLTNLGFAVLGATVPIALGCAFTG
jgi:hypothetical protein